MVLIELPPPGVDRLTAWLALPPAYWRFTWNGWVEEAA